MSLRSCMGLAFIVTPLALVMVLRHPIGVEVDSVTYLIAAQNLARGRGLLGWDGHPMIAFPPLYPALLSLTSILGVESLYGARVVQTLLYMGLLVLLAGLLANGVGLSRFLVTVAVLLVGTSPLIVDLYTVVWSESLFLAILVGWLWIGIERLKKEEPRRWMLLAALATLSSLAALTRYAGLALVLAGSVLELLASRDRLPRRLSRAVFFAAVAITPIVAWAVRNAYAAGTPLNRSMDFHPMTWAHVKETIARFAIWWFPYPIPSVVRVATVALPATLLALLLLRRFKSSPGRLWPWLIVSCVLLTVYLSFLALSVSFFDAYVWMSDRILAPAYIVTVVIVIAGVGLLSSRHSQAVAIGLCVLLVPPQVIASVRGPEERGVDGVGYQRDKWRRSDVMSYLGSLPKSTHIYSNAPDAIAMLLGREAEMLPRTYSPSSLVPNKDLQRDLLGLADELEGGAVIAVFDALVWRKYLVSVDRIQSTVPLTESYHGSDGRVYVTTGSSGAERWAR